MNIRTFFNFKNANKQNKRIVIVPDIHGRVFWRDVLENKDDGIIFLGDYSDPYPSEGITHKQAVEQLNDIIQFKKNNMDRVILLLGNHDDHYIHSNHAYSRFSEENFEEYNALYVENFNLFQIAYQRDSYLFTHAGVIPDWWNRHKNLFDSKIPIADSLNKAYKEFPDIFFEISTWRGGKFIYGSPIWADVYEHHSKGFKKFIQIFGHSQLPDNQIIETSFICLDCQKVFALENGGVIDIK